MARLENIVRTIKRRFSKKKISQIVRQQLSYEEVIRRYEELSPR